MSSEYTFNGYDMMAPGSRAGTAGTGMNLNSVTTQYTLKNNPALCKMVFDGTVGSYYGNRPTVTDGGTVTIDQLPTVAEIDTKGGVTMNPANPLDLAKMSGQIPTVQFTGAMSPMYRDAMQPTAFMPGSVPMMGVQPPMGFYGGMSQMSNGFMPINYMPTGAVPYNYNPANPSVSVPNTGAIGEWNEYQRTKGFRAPIPTDTNFPEFGLLSGFHKGFDPHTALAPKADDFYDPSLGGRYGGVDSLREQALRNAAMTWGYQPGDLVERREQMMFPGINEDHKNPVPSTGVVTDHSGRPQHRLGNTAGVGRFRANQLPVPNMVSTNPFMIGCSTVGGTPMNMSMQNVPTPYMQARYNYAISCGFQSIQEMDDNDFRILKHMSRCANDMSDEEFEEHFEKNWCARFIEKNEADVRISNIVIDEVPKIKVKLVKGGKVLASCDSDDPRQYQALCALVKSSPNPTQEQVKQAQAMKEYIDQVKEQRMQYLHANAPDRKYDHAPFMDALVGSLNDAYFAYRDFKSIMDRRDPAKRRASQMINQTAYLRKCMERGMGFDPIPAASARIGIENRMFMVNEDVPDAEPGGIRGDYGVYADGTPMESTMTPLYGYLTYIPDPKNPTKSISFPRKYIDDVYDGYVRYCCSTNRLSKSAKIVPMTREQFSEELGVGIVSDEEWLRRYSGLSNTDLYEEAAKEGVMQKAKVSSLEEPPSLSELYEGYDEDTK